MIKPKFKLTIFKHKNRRPGMRLISTQNRLVIMSSQGYKGGLRSIAKTIFSLRKFFGHRLHVEIEVWNGKKRVDVVIFTFQSAWEVNTVDAILTKLKANWAIA